MLVVSGDESRDGDKHQQVFINIFHDGIGVVGELLHQPNHDVGLDPIECQVLPQVVHIVIGFFLQELLLNSLCLVLSRQVWTNRFCQLQMVIFFFVFLLVVLPPQLFSHLGFDLAELHE